MSDYLAWLRAAVGRQRLLLVFATACLRDEAGRLLWQRRADFGWWGLPGGVMEADESLPDCVVREVREETGLEVAPTRLVGLYSSPDFQTTYPNGDQVQQVTACFECRLLGGCLQADPVETLDLAWLPLSRAPETAPWYRAMVADLAAGEAEAGFRRGAPGARSAGPPFYRRMRRRIGSAPLVLPAAAGLVRDEQGRVLLIRRSDTGEWALPGGAMELGERIDQTVVSELREETGLEVAPTRLLGLYSGPRYWLTYPNGDQARVVSAFFECRILGGELRPDGEESLEVRFFSPDALPPLSDRHLSRILDGLAATSRVVF